jgi:NAD(P)-dependent dehydrogenase (short-subunit alcohol dehydrogenase family)
VTSVAARGLARRTAMVTGAARGLGLEVTRQLLKTGIDVVALSRTDEPPFLGEDADAPGRMIAVKADVRDQAAVSDVMRDLGAAGIAIDILVNNAGVYLDDPRHGRRPLLERDLQLLEETLSVNLLGAARMAWAVMPAMMDRRHGRIVNVSSGMGRMGDFDLDGGFYRLSKLALNGLTILLAEHGRAHGVLVNAICPGWLRTSMGGEHGRLSVTKGARGVVWAALLPDEGPTGGFYRHGLELDWFAPSPRVDGGRVRGLSTW